MPRHPTYNKDGALVMTAAVVHKKIFSLPELATVSGVPYQTAHHDMSDQFCGPGFLRARAYAKNAGMTVEEAGKLLLGIY